VRAILLAALAVCTGCTLEPSEVPSCVEPMEIGSDVGHPDVFGAAAAHEARAGRILDASVFPQPAHGRQQIQTGDFVLANDKVAVVVEDRGLSDGYGRFGGEVIAVDQIGADGMPRGVSKYGETLIGFGLSVPNPTSVTVLADGSDGGAAIVRVHGRTEPIPFIANALGAVFGSFDLEVAHDYVLEPGAEHVTLRISIRNPTNELVDLGGIKYASDEIFGFFHTSQNQLVTPELGFRAERSHAWVGFVNSGFGFAWRAVEGDVEHALDESGFALFGGPGFAADACAITASDRAQIIGGGPEYDGLREAVRRVEGETPWRPITGVVRDAFEQPIAGAYVHELGADDEYLSRTITGADGTFTIHAPAASDVLLVAQKRGYLHEGTEVSVMKTDTVLGMEAHGVIHVTARAAQGGERLPVRIQVVPSAPLEPTPESFGAEDERDGRLYQEFAVTGEARLVVPPGEHRVIVTRGYEWELSDTTVTVAASETVEVDAVLEHSVDTSDVMCADFHIHSFLSADSSDPIEFKVRGAIADGLDIPASSEHEWAIDFQPVIEELGMQEWAYGLPSSELTTFEYGHFGVVPLEPLPGTYNNGAVDWIGLLPEETFAAVHAKPERPALIVNHPSGSGFGSYFSSMLVDEQTAEARDPRFSTSFDAIEVFNDSGFDQNRENSVAHWFALLRKGKKVFAVGNSDSHHLISSPVGYPRTCFFFGHDNPRQLTHDAVRDGILGGNSTISGGLYMTVAGPDGERPGGLVSAGGAVRFTVTVQSPSWLAATELEVLVNGESIRTEDLMPLGEGPGHRYVNQIDLDLAAGDFVVFHARSDADLAPLHPGRAAFAVSNPIFAE
jgi:hypothetical protein